MARQWQRFEGRRSLTDIADPRLTIQKGGGFGMNHALFVRLGEPARVAFLLDRAAGAFAVSPAGDGDEFSYPVQKQQSGKSYVIAARAFVVWAGIPNASMQRLAPTWEDGMAVFEIPEDGETDDAPDGAE